MAVTVQINGTTLAPQPQTTRWEPHVAGETLAGAEAIGAYYIHTLTAPSTRGGTANFNWDDYENQSLTSITTHPPGQTLQNGTSTTYNSGVVSKTLSYDTPPGDILQGVELRLLVVI